MNCSKDFLTDAPGLVQKYKLTLYSLIITFRTHAILISFFTISKSELKETIIGT